MAGRLKLKGARGETQTLKVSVSMARKRAMAKRAESEGGLDLATWARIVLYRELDDPRAK